MATSSLGIGVSVFLRDQFTSQANKINTSVHNLHRNMMNMSQESLKSIRSQSSAMLGLSAVAGFGMFQAAKNLGDFKDEMVYVKEVTKSSTETMDVMMTKAMELGKNTMFSTQDIASGMRYLAIAGYNSTEVLENITASANLAGATMSDLGGKGGAADVLTNIMTTFGIEASKSTDVVDKLSTIITSTNVDLTDMAEGFSYVGSVMTQLKIPLEESTVMLGLLNNQGVKASSAGTALANTWRYLTNAIGSFRTGRQDKALEILGLGPQDFATAEGKLKPIGEIIATMYGAAHSKTDIEGQNLLESMFGVRGAKGISPLMNQMKRYDELLASIKSNTHEGFAQNLMDARMGELKGLIDQMGNSWDAFMKRFTMGVEPLLKPLFKMIIMIANGFEKIFSIPYLNTFLSSAIVGFVAIKTAGWAYKVILTTIGLTYASNTMAFSRRVASTVAGYNSMSMAAANYNRAQRGGFMGGVLSTAPRGVMVNSAGRTVRSGTGLKGRGGFIKDSVKDRYQRMYGTAPKATGLMGGLGAAFGRFLPMMAGFLRFISGPWGLALSFILPGAIGLLTEKLSKNADSIDKNTKAIEMAKANSNITFSENDGFIDKSVQQEKRKAAGRTVPLQLSKGIDGKSTSQNINIYVDGLETTIKKQMDNSFRTDISDKF